MSLSKVNGEREIVCVGERESKRERGRERDDNSFYSSASGAADVEVVAAKKIIYRSKK